MKERPILFSAPMVRALLAGTKTQTRRLVKLQPHEDRSRLEVGHYNPTVIDCHGDGQPGAEKFGAWTQDGEQGWVCPYGQPGDRLWVREGFRFPESLDQLSPAAIGEKSLSVGYQAAWCPTQFEADGTRQTAQEWCDFVTPPMQNKPGRLRASIHMPRWASRIALQIAGIRVERLQDISIADAIAEGVVECAPRLRGLGHCMEWLYAYEDLWTSINGPGSWDANPLVWVVEFKRVEGGAA